MSENAPPARDMLGPNGPKLMRRFDVDWLRVFGMATVFFFHCSRFFDTESWHVKSPQTSPVVQIIGSFTLQWMMPLFFVLSGTGAYYALASQRWPQFLVSRCQRLVVPLLFGMLVIIAPWQIYLERVSRGQFRGSFWRFYPHYFEGWYMFGGNFAWTGVHLWYLELLFAFSALTLPLLVLLASHTGARLATRLSRLMAIPGLVFLPAALIFLTELVANSPAVRDGFFGQRYFGGWSVLSYLPMFLLGAVLGRSEEMTRVVERTRVAGLVVALVAYAAGYVLLKEFGVPRSGIVFAGLRGLTCWACLIALGGFASRHLRFNNGFLKYANEAVLPFYILHQTVVLTIGFYVLRLDTSLWVEYLLIATSSFLVIMAIYELLLRRINVLRLLFGMKPLRRPQPAPAEKPIPTG